jgi:hypothetical protein
VICDSIYLACHFSDSGERVVMHDRLRTVEIIECSRFNPHPVHRSFSERHDECREFSPSESAGHQEW